MQNFIKIGSAVWAVALTQTDRRTHAHTHTLGSIATYSVKMTEYKNLSRTKMHEDGYLQSQRVTEIEAEIFRT